MHLLRSLVAAGGRLRHHGDFDWGGVSIGNVLYTRLPVTPWRFDAAAYRAAATTRGGRELTGPAVTARWAPDLTGAMRELARCIEEELVLDDLLDDLACEA